MEGMEGEEEEEGRCPLPSFFCRPPAPIAGVRQSHLPAYSVDRRRRRARQHNKTSFSSSKIKCKGKKKMTFAYYTNQSVKNELKGQRGDNPFPPIVSLYSTYETRRSGQEMKVFRLLPLEKKNPPSPSLLHIDTPFGGGGGPNDGASGDSKVN